MVRKCVVCGRESVDGRFAGCMPCYQKLIGRPHEFLQHYLQGGYFKEIPEKGPDGQETLKKVIRPEIFNEEAKTVAMVLNLAKVEKGMNTFKDLNNLVTVSRSGLFKLYARLLGIYKSSKSKQTFEETIADLYQFEMSVKYAVGKKTLPQFLDEFVKRNIPLAIKGPEELAAFKSHFESIVAYFTYLRKDDFE